MNIPFPSETHDVESLRMMLNSLPIGVDIIELGIGGCKYLGVYDNIDYNSLILTDTDKSKVEHAVGRGLKANYIDYRKLPFDDNSFDVVLSVNEPAIYMRLATHISEVDRILRPHGIFGIIFPTVYHLDTEKKRIGTNLIPIVRLLKKNGFKIITETIVEAGVRECHILSRRVSN